MNLEIATRLEVSRASLEGRRADLAAYLVPYEDLVDILCAGAQFGPTPKLDGKYVELRRQLQTLYPAVRPFLVSYLEFAPNDEEAGLKLCGRPLDAFEVLTAAIDLREFFRLDDGNMISRLTRTREALTLYGDHLRLLAARLA